MKYLLSGTALAALAIAAPVWAQTPTAPSSTGTYSSGTPSTSTATPYAQPAPTYGQAAPSAQPMQQQMQRGAAMPAQPPATTAQQMPAPQAPVQPPAMATGRLSDQGAEGATQPTSPRHAKRAHQRRHHASRTAHTSRRGGQMNDNVADQLNREEANRVASGGTMPPGGAGQMPVQQGGQPMPPAPGPRPSGR